jgi:hypothetical protein
LTTTIKWLLISDSQGDSNCCTSYRRNLIHTTCMRSRQAVHGNLSRWLNGVRQIPLLPRKKDSRLHPQPVGWPISRSPPSFSPLIAIEAIDLSQSSIDNMLHRFTRLITPACDQCIQYLLTGPNPLVLNWHRRRLQSWRCRFFTSLSRPSQPMVLRFSLRALSDLKLTMPIWACNNMSV